MQTRYKLIISNRNIYKEIEIDANTTKITIGTAMDCDIRLRKDMFFVPVELVCEKINENWEIYCSNNLYFSVGDVRKLLTKQLIHGDNFLLKYQDSDNDLFQISFMIDFDYQEKDYERTIYLDDKEIIKIGALEDCDIILKDDYLDNDSFILKRENGKYIVEDINTKYGIYLNGNLVKKAEVHDKDFISIVSFSFYFDDGVIKTTKNQSVNVKHLRYELDSRQTSHFNYPKFNRNSRIKYVVPEEKLQIQQPVSMPKEQKKSLLMTLVPSIVMLAVTIVLRGVIGGGGTFVIYSAISMSMGIGMSVVTYLQEKKNYKEEYENRIQNFNNYIEEKKEIIETSRENELRVLNLMYESTDKSIEEIQTFGKRLFERTQDDEDFLKVYLGKGKIESVNPIQYSKPEFIDLKDPLANTVETIAESYRYIENGPIIADFKSSCGVGVVGTKEQQYQIFKNMVLDLSARHFFTDVKMTFILDFNNVSQFEWVKWIPHVDNEQLGIKNIICDEESQNIVLEYIYSILSQREAIVSEDVNCKFDEHYIIFVLNNSAIKSHPVSKYIKSASDFKFTFVFFEEYEELLPQGCKEIIRLNNLCKGNVLKSENGDNDVLFVASEVSDIVMKSSVMHLAPVYVDKINLEGQLTKNISMFELLDIFSVDDLDLEKRWNESQVYKSMAAPLGVKNKNQIVSLDISDKSKGHGPHGLVAGTTGSGKSEILQTYILSMASLFHPYDVGFVIIDFKGGGMANQFKELPHLIGAITNIDGREINRSLRSIKAEIIKRQEMFSGAGVNHINDYIRLFKEGKVGIPMPHLIMIVDEFAELKAEHPDFMKELISAARIGRTLGVHLILATQKPAGVVDAQIWSNSKFKLCLKVQTKEDSNEVIKTPLAAEIVEPGRAYFQVGNNEIFELFQSAYSGAAVPEGSEVNAAVVDIYEENLWGKKTLKYTNRSKKENKNSISQLQAIVKYLEEYCEQKSIKKLPGICLPSLDERISTDNLDYENRNSELITVPVGIFDDPDFQRQEVLALELSKENVYVVGSAQSGKTVMLQTIIYGLIRSYTPSEVNLYLVDCGSMVLKIFEESAHVGGVVISNENEKCRNLFKLLNTIISDRKKILSSLGIGNYASYLEAGYNDMPLVVVVIDNYAAFKEYFPEQADEIGTLTREAQGVGISFIVTAVNSNALTYRVQSNFSRKLALNCNDTGEYNSLFGRCKETPKETPGRGLCYVDKRVLEYQTAVYGTAKREADRSQEIIKYIEERNNEVDARARKIPMIPEKLVLPMVMSENPQLFRSAGKIPLGMDFATVDFVGCDMYKSNMLALVGSAEGRESFVKNFLDIIAKNIVFHDVEAIIIDEKVRAFEKYSVHGFVRQYVCDPVDAVMHIEEFCDDVMANRDNETQMEYRLLVVNSNEVLKNINADKLLSKRFAEVIKSMFDTKAFIIFANIENQPIGFNASDVLKTIKDTKRGIFFGTLSENKVFEISGRPKAENITNESIGYYFLGNDYSKIKMFDREE